MRSNAAHATRWAIGFAAGGVLAGHGLTYALVHPDGHERGGVLAATGHAYLHLLEGPGLVLALASAVAALLLGMGRLGAAPDRGTLFRRLAAIQVGAFVAMEAIERLRAGAAIGTSGDLALLAIGVTVQLTLARAGAWLLASLHRTGERLAEALGRRRSTRRSPLLAGVVPGATSPVSVALLAIPPGRGPPPRRR